MEYLIVKVDGSSPVAFPIIKSGVIIGRDSICDIFLSHSSVSREHARIFHKDKVTWLADNNSLNGTFVNGKKIFDPVKIKQGDELTFGYVETRYDHVPDCRTTITKTVPWVEVDETGRLGFFDNEKNGLLSFIIRVGVALDYISEENTLLAKFSLLFNNFLNVNYSGFYLYPKEKNNFEINKWFKGEQCLDNKKDRIIIEAFDIEMVMEGLAYITELSDERLGRNARMFIPVSSEDAIIGFLVCISSQFNDQALRLGAVMAKLIGLALSRSRKIFSKDQKEDHMLFKSAGWIGQSRLSTDVFAKAAKYALGDSPVVIYGESGTGKELVAKFLGEMSDRRNGPFVAFNCATISKRIAESELFGHVKGAFTDAVEDKKGLLEQADQGIIFLDEIGDLPLDLQPKLLRAIETKMIRKVGSEEDIHSDFRVISATNRNIAKMVEEKKFRLDLFYRIQVLSIEIPPLRRRPEDIDQLLDHFIKLSARKLNRDIPTIDLHVRKKLLTYNWPGNVRELKNTVERAMYAHNKGKLQFSDFELSQCGNSYSLQKSESWQTLSEAIAGLEKKMIETALKQTNWNKKRAAESLGITRQTLDRKIAIFNFDESK